MRNPLNKRLSRDLKKNSGRYISIFFMMVVTISVISSFLMVAENVKNSFEQNRIDCKIEDGLFNSYLPIADDTITEVEKLGVAVYENYYTEQDVLNDKNLRIFKNRENIDLATVIDGHLPTNKNEIAIDRLFAQNNNLNVDDIINIKGTYTKIVGYISIPDYSSLFENNSDLMMNSSCFGVAVVNEEMFNNLSKNNITYNYSYYFDNRNLNESEKRSLSNNIKDCLINNHTVLINFLTAENNQSISFAGEDMGSDILLMKVFLFIILVIMAFVFSVIISSTIESESVIIGTLLSSGYNKYELLHHYMELPVLITIISAGIGNILGYTVFPNFFKKLYYDSYSLPPMSINFNIEAFIFTTIIPFFIMGTINFFILNKKLSITPLRFLHKDLKQNKNKKLIKLPNFQFISRFRLRVILQNKSSYIVLFVGILFASFILLYGLCIEPMLKHYVNNIQDSFIANYQYNLNEPVEVKSNNKLEKFTATSLKTYYQFTNQNIRTTFYGLNENSIFFTDLSISENESGAIFSEYMLKKANAKIGDTITFTNTFSNATYDIKIVGSYNYPVGLSVFMNQKQLNKMLDQDANYFNGYFSDKALNIDETYISTIITPDKMADLGEQILSGYGQMAPLCLGSSIIIYLILIYLITKIIIDKNAINISFIKILGYSEKEIKKIYLNVTAIVVLLSLIISLPLIAIGMKYILIICFWDFSGYMEIYIPYYLYFEIFVIGILSYYVINFFHTKKVKRIKMNDALKNRE